MTLDFFSSLKELDLYGYFNRTSIGNEHRRSKTIRSVVPTTIHYNSPWTKQYS